MSEHWAAKPGKQASCEANHIFARDILQAHILAQIQGVEVTSPNLAPHTLR